MHSHPYDTFFDESLLSKAAPDHYNSIIEMNESKKVLQKFLDTKKTRQAPSDLNEELF